MADSFLTLADLAKVNDQNNADYGISDLLDEAPVLRTMAAEPTDGDTHKYLKQTGAPTVGFRTVNDGRENTKSADTEVTVTLKLLDCSFVVDKAIADQYRFGASAYIGREARTTQVSTQYRTRWSSTGREPLRRLKRRFGLFERGTISGTRL